MSSIVATTPRNVMDPKVATYSQEHQKQQQNNYNNNQEPLKCPRCDSSNTKFCYYNNYSLSQPRHFCKACKRYWTRGGTLRSVPVGGGCRKNKRVKRSNNSSTTNNTNNTSNNNSNLNETCGNNGHNSIHDLISHGMPTNNNPLNFPFSRFDLENPPQINCLGLGFSSGLIENGDFRNGFNVNLQNKQIFQDLISPNSYPSNSTSTPTISSLLASSFGTILPSYDDSLQMKGNGELEMLTKDVKMEGEGQNRSFDHQWSAPSQNQMENIVSSSSDPSLIWGSGPNLGAWLDYPSNNNHLGSSVPSLI